MIRPQGYKLGEDPKNKNPFWGEGEDSSVNRIYATATVDDGTGVPSVTTSKTVSGSDITFGFDFHNLKGKDGVGKKGDPGFSPSARVEQTEAGATITVTDKSGTTTASITNGTPGKSGFSPSARVEQTETGATITVTDKSGTTTATVKNGVGKKGDPGFSPSARVEQTEAGATITVTDESGTTTATVKNGEPGIAGPGVPAGGTAGQVLTKVDGTDYNTEWKDPTGGGGGTGQQLVKWVEDDTATNVYPRHSYEGYNINRQSAKGSALETVTGTMDNIKYTITFSDNVTLSISAGFQYLFDNVMLTPDLRLPVNHKSTLGAFLRIPDPYNDIIITAEGQAPVKAQSASLKCTIFDDGSTIYIKGTINTDSGSIITMDDSQILFSIISDYVNKYEVLKTV